MKAEVTFNNMPELVGKIYNELLELKQAVQEKLPEAPTPKQTLNTKEALEYLDSIGYSISAHTLSKKCSLGHMDGLYRLIGRERGFNKEKLKEWVDSGCPNMNEIIAAERLKK